MGYEKSSEADKLKGQVSTHEQEVKRLKKQVDSLESELKKASSQSHTSSLMVPQKDDQQRSEARIDMGGSSMSREESKMSSSSTFERSVARSTPAVEVTIERKSSSSYQTETTYGSRNASRKGSMSGERTSRPSSRPGSRVGSRSTSRPTSPSPYDQQTTDEESELRRILEDSRGRRTKFQQH